MQNKVSLKVIIDRVLRNPLLSDLPLESAIDYAVEVIGLIGSPFLYDKKITRLKVENNRVALPLDLVEITQMRVIHNQGTEEDPCSLEELSEEDEPCNIEQKHNKYSPLRLASNNFHMNNSNTCMPKDATYGYTYSINNSVIYTNFEQGCIELAYTGVGIDDDGFPVIPDDESVKTCIENYIKVKHYTIIWELGKLPDKVLQRAEQEYAFYIAQATGRLNMPTPDKMEKLTNTLRRLINPNNSYDTYFETDTFAEKLKRH